MRSARLVAFALACAFVQPALAKSVSVGFAPPVDHDFLYRIDQHRPVEGRDCLFSATRALRFERAGDVYILHMTLRALDSDAPASGAEPYRAALTPLLGIEHRFRIDTSGRIVALDNIDAVWTQVQAALQKMIDTMGADSPRGRAANNVLTLFSGLPPEGRLALLAGEVQPLFLFAGSRVEDGPGRGVRTTAGSPLGRPVPVEGVVTLAKEEGDQLAVEEKLSGADVAVDIRYRLSAATGLVMEQRRSLAMGDRHLAETRTLTAAGR